MRFIKGISAILLVAMLGVSTPSVEASGQHYDDVQQQIFNRFEPYGVGDLMVRVSYFEGYGSSSRAGCNWSVTCISSSGDACPLQVNQVHDDTSYSAIRVVHGDDARWPDAVLTLQGCLDVAEYLFVEAGLSPWVNSRHNWQSRAPIAYGPDAPIFAVVLTTSPSEGESYPPIPPEPVPESFPVFTG